MWRFQNFLLTAGFLVFNLSWGFAETQPTSLPGQKSPKPNIVFILADDMGYADAACYGGKLIKTPYIDELAKEGVRFTQCYAGDCLCAPSRCSLMTGFHTGHTRIRGNISGMSLLPEDITVAEILKAAGYDTGVIGKWGLGNEGTTGGPNHKGFDYSFGYLDQEHAHDYYTDHLFRNERSVPIPPKTYSHDLFTKEALEFIERERSKTFFLYLPYTIPHSPFNPPKDEVYRQYANETWIERDKNYAAMITRMDRDIGKIMDLLKKLDLEKNTIVFFTSDNGGGANLLERFQCNGPLRGAKEDTYEGGIREPMIIRWPGKIAPNTTNDFVWAFWDFLPTAAEIAGVKPPANIDGISVLPAILGKKQAGHEYLYWEVFGGFAHTFTGEFKQGVRVGDWKAVKPAPDRPTELYNLKADIGEKENLAVKNPEILAKMENYLKVARMDSPDWIIGKDTRKNKGKSQTNTNSKTEQK